MAFATTAKADYEPQTTIGSAATLNLPFSVAVDDLTGNRYAGSFLMPGEEGLVGGWTIEFDSSGNVLGPVRSESLVSSVAVRQTTGHLYIRDALGGGPSSAGGISIYNRDGVQVGSSFTMTGVPLWGQIAVDEETGNVYAADSTSAVRIYDTSVNPVTEVGTVSGEGENALSAPTGVALDSAGNVYVADNLGAGGRVQKFDSDGEFVEVFSSGDGEVSLAIDQSSGDVFVGALAEPETSSGFHVIAYDAGGTEFDDFGAGEFAPGPGLPLQNQPAVDPTTGQVIVPDAGNNVMRVYGEPVPPTATTGAASSVTQTTATLEGEIDPEGWEVTECEFAYGEAGGPLSETVECEQTVGGGTAPVEVSADISGLDPNTEYEFELAGANAWLDDEGQVESFTTLVNPPSVSGASASVSGQNAATVKATVDANEGQSSCVVEWGTSTAYGNEVPCAPATVTGDAGTAVSASLAGLAAGTTYHFRVVATNAGGSGQATGSFTTEAAPVPPVAAPPVTAPVDNSAAKAACVKKANDTAKKSIQTANKKVGKAKGKKAKAKAQKAAAKAKKTANKKKNAAIKNCGS